jgi:outer membrane protein
MMKQFFRPLLAAVLAGIMAGAPAGPLFAQEPAPQSPPTTTPAAQPPTQEPVQQSPSPTLQPATQGGAPVSLGVSKYNFSKGPSYFPNIIKPYTFQFVKPGELTNSPRLEQLIHNGKMDLSLQDAIALAMENSMDIVVQRYNPWMADTGILHAQAGGFGYQVPGADFISSTANLPQVFYDPYLTQTIAYDSRQTPINNPFISGTGSNGSETIIPQVTSLPSHTAQYNTAFQKSFDTGTAFSVNWDNTRASSGAANFFNPYVQSALTVNIQQQLLAGSNRSVNRRNIIIAENNRKIADLAFSQQAITTITNTIIAYWELFYARQNVVVQQQALTVSEKLYNDNKKQLAIGTMAPLDVTRAESEMATDKQNLIVAQTTRLQNEIVLKNDISKDPLASDLINVEIIPTDKPDAPSTIQTAAFEDALKEAFAKRPDLQEQYFNLKNADVDVRATKNALLPTATLSAGYGTFGLAGNAPVNGIPTSISTGTPVVDGNGVPIVVGGVPYFVGGSTAPVLGIVHNGFGNTQAQIFHNDFADYNVALTFQLPLRNRAAQADNVHAQLTLRQLEAQTQQIKNSALLDVRNTTITVEQDRARVDAAVKARELQQQTFDAEQKKYQLGASTVYNVILTQRDLITAQGTELRALADLAEAKANYERALGRTLDVNSVTIAGVKNGNGVKDSLIPGTRDGQVVGTDALFKALDKANAAGQK